jgi:dihydrolipoamide dehydrogenase
MSERYDLIVIGAGPGGYVAAIRAAQLGKTVALVDKRKSLGGTCLNIGCIPSKALLDSSELFIRSQKDLAEHGIRVKGVELDLGAMMNRKDQVVKRFTSGLDFLMKANRIEVFHGTGRLISPALVGVRLDGGGERELSGGAVLIATGSVPAGLPFLDFDSERVISSTEALSLDAVPKRLAVVGAGAIGLELGSVWSRLGSEVSVIEIMDTALPGWDRGTSRTLKQELAKQGITFLLEARVEGFEEKGEQVTLKGKDRVGKEFEVKADRVLVAVGRRPYTEGLGLDAVGLEIGEKDCLIPVDEAFQTGVSGIYAIGDVVGAPMLAHKAEEEGIAVAENLGGKAGHVSYETIPNVVYTWPEVASCGRTEEQLASAGIPFRRGTFAFRANGRALAMGDTAGFVKVLAHERSDRILGVHIIGPWASSLIAEAVAVMEFGGSSEDLARISHAHPTLSEAVREAALAVESRAIHAK